MWLISFPREVRRSVLFMLLHVLILELVRIFLIENPAVTVPEDLEGFGRGRTNQAHLVYQGVLGVQSRSRVCKRLRVGGHHLGVDGEAKRVFASA